MALGVKLIPGFNLDQGVHFGTDPRLTYSGPLKKARLVFRSVQPGSILSAWSTATDRSELCDGVGG